MTLWRPDPSFYPSPRLAMTAPPERIGYVATLNVEQNNRPDALSVVDLDVNSPTYSQIIHNLELPYLGDELHHFGWNACSSALCPHAPHPHLERRYLIVPAIRSSRIYIIDTKPDATQPHITKILEPAEVLARAGYSRLHTVHCGPDAIYISAMGAANGNDGPGGIFLLDHFNFEVLGKWEIERGLQELAYDFWWHLSQDVLISSEWGKPHQFENGLVPEELLAGRYGHQLHFWDIRKRRNKQTIDFGSEYQMVLELRPAHEPTKNYGFVNVVINLKDLSSSIWTWYEEKDQWHVKKVIDIPAEPAAPHLLPPALQPFKVVPPLVTDIDLSLDDRFLYVSCWGSGELRQYDVSDPFQPQLIDVIRLGGVIREEAHPRTGPLVGGPQMVEISRDGQRVYFTNSLYSTWDEQLYPGDFKGWMAKVNVGRQGGMAIDPDFFVDFGRTRPHQVRLEGGDASTDTFCYPS